VDVAMLRRRLWDIDAAVNRTLVWTALTVTLVGGYTVVVGVLGQLLSGTVAAPAVAAAAVAAVLVPLHRRLQEGVDRLQFGLRRDPYALVDHVHRVSTGATADDLSERIAGVLADALRVPYAAVEIETPDGDVLRGASGEDRYGANVVPLRTATFNLSTKTVRNYLTVIPRRLGVPDRAAVLGPARPAGLGRGRNRPATPPGPVSSG
jgi:hypothetical protein